MLHDIAITSIAAFIVLVPQLFAAWYDGRQEVAASEA
jgi:hypothetical protein